MPERFKPPPQPDREPTDPFRLPPSEQFAKLRDTSLKLFYETQKSGVDLDIPVMPLAHMDRCKQLAEIVVRASTLIGQLGLDPEFMVSLKIAELQGGEGGDSNNDI